MTLSSVHTLGQVRDTYRDNVGYDLSGGSTAKCELFIQACRILQGIAKRAKSNGEEFEFDPETLNKQEQAAIAWLDGNSTATTTTGPGSVRYMDLSEFRT